MLPTFALSGAELLQAEPRALLNLFKVNGVPDRRKIEYAIGKLKDTIAEKKKSEEERLKRLDVGEMRSNFSFR